MKHPVAALGRTPQVSRSVFWTLLIAGTALWPAGAAIAVSTPLAAGAWLAAAGFALIALGVVTGFVGVRRSPAA